ncbi:MAG: 16S rRNA (guanine(966)-N(2))-methyltransferase RsmD [Lachnospiraceae bacterium]|nr:16S rRNA (guanine(966)-N(2))-methyltransferase RsmD [Lachnospiraceae bacterium]
MRVIAGKARSLKLMTPPGMDTRPTTDRTKETLFNILQPEIGGARFLDLFSGSGAIGIEALSRGAAFAVFVEKDRAAAECIKKNLAFTKLGDNGQILRKDVGAALKSLEKGEPFDLIFMDPPYGRGLERQVLEYLAHSSLLAEEGTVVVEASLETTFDHVQDLGFQVIKIKKYKTNMHVWIVKGEKDVESSVSGEL